MLKLSDIDHDLAKIAHRVADAEGVVSASDLATITKSVTVMKGEVRKLTDWLSETRLKAAN